MDRPCPSPHIAWQRGFNRCEVVLMLPLPESLLTVGTVRQQLIKLALTATLQTAATSLLKWGCPDRAQSWRPSTPRPCTWVSNKAAAQADL